MNVKTEEKVRIAEIRDDASGSWKVGFKWNLVCRTVCIICIKQDSLELAVSLNLGHIKLPNASN